MARAALAILSALLGFGVIAGAASAARDGTAGRALVMHPRFRQAAAAPGHFMAADGNSVYLEGVAGSSSGILLDERTGRQSVLSMPGCTAAFFGGPWLLFDCFANPQTVELYSVARRSWQTVALNAQAQPIAVGRDWIDLLNDPTCPDIGPCDLAPTHLYQNIATGAVRRSPEISGATTVVDLDQASLSRRLCQPLRIGDLNIGNADVAAPLTWYGTFAMTTTATTEAVDHTYLEHCGTHLHRLLSTTMSTGYAIDAQVSRAGNPHLVVWPSAPYTLSGLFLPSLRPFRVSVPHRVGRVQATTGGLDQLFVTSRHLYLLNGTTLWAAPVPSAPPA